MEHKICNLFRIAREIETQTALISLAIEGTKIDDFARGVRRAKGQSLRNDRSIS